jgi:hypothetical protein
MALLSRIDGMAWHRRLGLVTCAGILFWSLSGLSHPIMSRQQPKPVAFAAPSQSITLAGALSPAAVLAMHGISHLRRLSVVTLEGEDYFRVGSGDSQPARFFSVTDGKEVPSADEVYARSLASHYTGLPAERIVEARFVTGFSDDYHSVNRLLPVWRIQFSGDEGLRAFIDTDQGKLATLVDDRRYALTGLFRFGHNWSFAEAMPGFQLGIMASVLGIALFSAISGLYLYYRQRLLRRRRVSRYMATQSVRLWHRRLGLLVAASTLLFAGSGLFHLFMSFKQEHSAIPARTVDIPADRLSTEAWQRLAGQDLSRIDLVSDGKQAYWLLQDVPVRSQVAALAQEALPHEKHDHDHHRQAPAKPALRLLPAGEYPAPAESIMQLAQRWAVGYADQAQESIRSTEVVDKFGGEYGFVFKRLPVVKVQFDGPGNPRYYLEPVNGILAAKITDLDATEGWVFAYLHKWVFADANKDLRDLLVMLFALGNTIVAILGLVMFLRHPRPRRRMKHFNA